MRKKLEKKNKKMFDLELKQTISKINDLKKLKTKLQYKLII